MERTTSVGSFFAVSSSLTSVLIFIVYLLTLETSMLGLKNPVVLKATLLYLLFYAATLLFLFAIIFSLGVKAGSTKLPSLITSSTKPYRVTSLLKVRFFIALSSFAGVPPLSSFFTKLLVLTNLNSSATLPMQLTILILFTYLFTMLLFYFKFVSFLFVKGLNTPHTGYVRLKNTFAVFKPGFSEKKLKLNLTHLYNFIIVFLVFGFFLTNDLILYLYM